MYFFHILCETCGKPCGNCGKPRDPRKTVIKCGTGSAVCSESERHCGMFRSKLTQKQTVRRFNETAYRPKRIMDAKQTVFPERKRRCNLLQRIHEFQYAKDNADDAVHVYQTAKNSEDPSDDRNDRQNTDQNREYNAYQCKDDQLTDKRAEIFRLDLERRGPKCFQNFH